MLLDPHSAAQRPLHIPQDSQQKAEQVPSFKKIYFREAGKNYFSKMQEAHSCGSFQL